MSVFLFSLCVCSCLNWFSNVLVISFYHVLTFDFNFFVLYYYLLLTTVTFTNLFLARTFVAAFNKLYCI